jgi:nucleotide-binding universal stress UspA family protein
VALYWLNVCEAEPAPLTIRVLGKDRDVRLDIAGGSRIPKYAERGPETAQILAELRASWHGVEKLLLAYDGSPLSVDFLDTVLSFLDPAIGVTLIDVAEPRPGTPATASAETEAREIIERGVERARELGRAVDSLVAQGDPGPQIVRVAQEGKYDAIFLSLRGDYRARDTIVTAPTTRYVLEHAPCRVILGFAPKSIAQSSGVTAPVAQASTI